MSAFEGFGRKIRKRYMRANRRVPEVVMMVGAFKTRVYQKSKNEYVMPPPLYPFIFLVCIYTHARGKTHVKVHNVTRNSAMPKSNSNLHHSIGRAQIDNSTLLKIENW